MSRQGSSNKHPPAPELFRTIAHCVRRAGGCLKADALLQLHPSLRSALRDFRLLEALKEQEAVLSGRRLVDARPIAGGSEAWLCIVTDSDGRLAGGAADYEPARWFQPPTAGSQRDARAAALDAARAICRRRMTFVRNTAAPGGRRTAMTQP